MAQGRGRPATVTRKQFLSDLRAVFDDSYHELTKADSGHNPYSVYMDDPCGFIENELQEIVTPDLRRMLVSFRDNETTLARSANAVGKAECVDNLIPTPEGWRRIGDISAGDRVFGSDGLPIKVLKTHPQGFIPVYRITFSDGASLLCSGDHLWTVRTSSQKARGARWQTLTTLELRDRIATMSTYRHTHIPMCGAVAYPSKDLPVAPYTLGAMIGDGILSGSGVAIATSDPEVLARIERESGVEARLYSGCTYGLVDNRRGKNGLIDGLRAAGMMGKRSYEKRIPADYLIASVDQRMALLRGLMDSDGTIGKGHSATYTTTSEGLARDMVELIQSLGGTAKVRSRVTSYTHNGEKRTGRVSYRLGIKTPFCPFVLPRKAARYRPEHEMQRQAHRLVSAIEEAGSAECVCLSVDAADRLYLTSSYIVTHNTWAAARAIWWMFLSFQHEKVEIYCACAPPIDNLKNLLWKEIMSVAKKHPHLVRNCRVKSLRIEIKGDPEKFITGVAIPQSARPEEIEASFSGKHSEHLAFVFDESDGIPNPVYVGRDSCLSSQSRDRPMAARSLLLYNARKASGPVYQQEITRQGKIIQISALSHPNVVTGKDIIAGAVTRETTVRRINEWTRLRHPDEDIAERFRFTPPQFLVGHVARGLDGLDYAPLSSQERVITDDRFFYMVLAEYPPAGGNRLIHDDWIDAAVDRWKLYVAERGMNPPDCRPILGMDTADEGDDENVIFKRYEFGEASFVSMPITFSGLDADLVAMRAAEVAESSNASYMFIDATSFGRGVAPRVRKATKGKTKARGIHFSTAPTKSCEEGDFYMIRDQMYWSLRQWLERDPTSMLPNDPKLLEELRTPGFDHSKKGKVYITAKDVLKKVLGRSPDRMEALIMTFYPTRGLTRLPIPTVRTGVSRQIGDTRRYY